MVNQNKIFSFKIKRKAKNVFPRDVEKTVNLQQRLCALYSAIHKEFSHIPFIWSWESLCFLVPYRCPFGISVAILETAHTRRWRHDVPNYYRVTLGLYVCGVKLWNADSNFQIQSTLVTSNSKGLYLILRDIRTSTYKICRIEEKIIRKTTFNKYICNWTLEVRDILKILWKRGEIAPYEQFLLFSTIFFCLLLDVRFRQGLDFHFEISGYSR